MAIAIAKPLATAILLSISLFLCGISCGTAAQEIAFAFTDTLSRSKGLDGLARTKMLVNSLQRMNVPPAMFLIRTADINSSTLARVAFYDEMGQLLINAGHNDSSYSRKTERYIKADIAKANVALSRYSHYRQHIYLPYLYSGGDSHLVSDLQQYLTAHNYQPSYTTYQARDDYLDQRYQAQLATGSTENLERLKKAYVNLVVDDIGAYSAQALLMLGYYPRQVILLHETDLTAYTLVSLVDALREKGFTLISAEQIFSDPVANPFFSAGYSATGYMQTISGLVEPRRSNLYLPSATEEQKINAYIMAQGIAADH